MDRRPIGIFDSGLGGLTVAREIMTLLPEETIVFLGDTANLPYGDKSEEIIRKYSAANAQYLLDFDIKVLVVACNTASAVALDYLKERFAIPIIGVIDPAAKGALYATRNRKIGVIGTNRTIKSDKYASFIHSLESDAQVFSKACPLFVPLIEENFIENEATRLIATEYLKGFLQDGIDTLVLGCTHYPLIKPVIAGILPEVKLVDSASSTAKDLLSVLESHQMRMTNEKPKDAKNRFFVTDMTEKFPSLANRILQEEVQFEEVKLVYFEEGKKG